MDIWRFLRVTVAAGLALTTAASMFVVGCVSKAEKGPPVEEAVCYPVPPPVPFPVHGDGRYGLSHILFENDKAVLDPSAKVELEKVRAMLKAQPKYTLEIVGHTSDSGSHEHNVELGKRRAEMVKAYLVEQGIAPERMTTESKGDPLPDTRGNSPEENKRNRCVVFNYTIRD